MNRVPNIQAVTFDVGGTLIDPWPSVGHVYAQVAAEHGLGTLSPEMLNQRFITAWRARPGLVQTESAWADIVDEVFLGLVERPPSRTFFPELYQRFSEPAAWRVYNDVLPTLKALRARGLRLGVISNWDDRLQPLLGGLGFDVLFHTMVVSCEAGFSKPTPGIFRTAADRLGVEARAILHVGDSLEMDFHGARNAGFHAVQIVRASPISSDGQVQSLLDLVSLV